MQSKFLITKLLFKLFSCIVVVSEDDNICQNCINLFNRLDNTEIELRNVRAGLMRQLEHTYLNKKKAMQPLPNHVYRALKILIKNEQDEKDQVFKKRKYDEIVEFQDFPVEFQCSSAKVPLYKQEIERNQVFMENDNDNSKIEKGKN